MLVFPQSSVAVNVFITVPPQGPPINGPCEQLRVTFPQLSVAVALLAEQAGTSARHCTVKPAGQLITGGVSSLILIV